MALRSDKRWNRDHRHDRRKNPFKINRRREADPGKAGQSVDPSSSAVFCRNNCHQIVHRNEVARSAAGLRLRQSDFEVSLTGRAATGAGDH